MLNCKISIILIVLFCLIFIILYSEVVPDKVGQDISNNETNNKNDQEFQKSDSSQKFIIFDVLKIAFGATFVFLLGIIANRYNIRHKEYRIAKKKFRKVFEDLLWEIKNSDLTLYAVITDLVYYKFPITDKAIGVFLPKVWCIKRKKIKTAYNNYKNANNVFKGQSQDMLLSTYCFDEDKMKEIFGRKTKIKSGKDLLFYNLQQIIDLAK